MTYYCEYQQVRNTDLFNEFAKKITTSNIPYMIQAINNIIKDPQEKQKALQDLQKSIDGINEFIKNEINRGFKSEKECINSINKLFNLKNELDIKRNILIQNYLKKKQSAIKQHGGNIKKCLDPIMLFDEYVKTNEPIKEYDNFLKYLDTKNINYDTLQNTINITKDYLTKYKNAIIFDEYWPDRDSNTKHYLNTPEKNMNQQTWSTQWTLDAIDVYKKICDEFRNNMNNAITSNKKIAEEFCQFTYAITNKCGNSCSLKKKYLFFDQCGIKN